MVGGGWEIAYAAPSAGTAYWVEETTGKILETKSLQKDESFEGDLTLLEPEQIEQVVGVSLGEARFSLYFVPIPIQE